jgi:hypothetical protein
VLPCRRRVRGLPRRHRACRAAVARRRPVRHPGLDEGRAPGRAAQRRVRRAPRPAT